MEEAPCQHGAEARMFARDGRRLSIFAAKLLAGGGQQRAVRVWAKAGGETHAIGTVSPEKPVAPVPCVTLRGEFVLCQDSADATVRIYYRFLPDRSARAPAARLVEPTVVAGVELEPLDEDEDDDDDSEIEDSDGELDLTMTEFYDLGPPPLEYGEEEQQADHSEDEDELGVEYELPSEEDDAEHNDSDNGEDEDAPRKARDNGDGAAGESSRSASAALVEAPSGNVVPVKDGDFLGPARFAAVENTAGFMRVAAVEAAGGEAEGKEIVVLYRYTRFSKTWSGRRGVEACRRTKLHWLRFTVPPGGDMATSLAWAGASLGPLIYPALFRRQLHELWTSLASPSAMNGTVPPRAARLQVVVDVGILRRDDHTPERMAHMRGEMEAKMREPWPEYYHFGMELRLPEPVPDAEEERGESARTAKRRKVAANDEECSVCFDPMESGLAAWLGCRHVFHGACVEKTLAGSEMCPLCRKKLSDQPVR